MRRRTRSAARRATGRNLISANHWGVPITGALATGNVVQGNFIGTDITGLASLGNELDGVLINQGASEQPDRRGTVAAGNTIAFNRRDGVRIEDASVGNAILTNSIFANLGLGIDLVASARPPSPNRLQAAPTLTDGRDLGQLHDHHRDAGQHPEYRLHDPVLRQLAARPDRGGRGRAFLGQTTAMTGADGVATFSANVPTTLKSGQFVTATATDSSGNTSEFSSPITEVFGTVQFQMASYMVSEGAGTATIVATRTGGSGGLFTVNYATADGTARAGSDYLPASGTLTFDPGEDTQTFTVTILDNGLPEGDKTVLLGLSNPIGPDHPRDPGTWRS